MPKGMAQKTVDRLSAGIAKAQALGAAGAKVVESRSESIHVKFQAGRLKDTGSAETRGFAVDVLRDGRRGQAYAVEAADLDRTVERAVGLARIGSVAHFAAWPAPEPAASVRTWSGSAASLPRERLTEACTQIAETLKAYCADLYIDCQAGRTESETALGTSGGVFREERRSHWWLGAYVQKTEDTDMLMTGDSRSWGRMNDFFDPAAVADRILQQLKWGEKIVEPPTGRVKAFLTPEVLALFCMPLRMGINGRSVAKGESPLAGRIGERILAPCFTITDDPHRPHAPEAAETDSDGIPTRKQTLVEKGVLKCFLYDLDSAGLAGAKPTGNRGCSPYSLVFRKGRRSSRDLLAGIEDGLYLTENLIGYGQSNMMNGDFSCNVGLGYRIRKGEIVGRVKNTMVAGNLYEILKDNVALSSDTDYEGNVPYAVVEGVTASARTG